MTRKKSSRYVHYRTHIVLISDHQSVRDVSSGRLRAPDNLDHLASLETEISGHRVTLLYPHQLVVLEFVPATRKSILGSVPMK